MITFRIFLAALLLMVVGYTIPVLMEHGISPLFSTFFGDMSKFGWAGQFNNDFMGFLVLSAVWLAWRHHFSAAGLALGVGGFFGGIPFLTGYLLIVSFQSNDDIVALFVGENRADAYKAE